MIVSTAVKTFFSGIKMQQQDEQLVINFSQLRNIPLRKSLLLWNNYVANSIRFINHFSDLCESKLNSISNHLTRLEVSIQLLETKLNSIPDLSPIASTDTIHSETIPPAPAPPAPADTTTGSIESKVCVKDDIRYAKYFTLLKMNVPHAAIVQKMEMDGVDPSILEYVYVLKKN